MILCACKRQVILGVRIHKIYHVILLHMEPRRKKIILLVEDCSNTAFLIKQSLLECIREYHLEILVRPDSLSGLKTLDEKQGDIDLISTDIYHPKGNGLRFIRVCREVYPHIPIILCSGRASEIDAREMLESDLIRKCFSKPFNVKEYVQAVREIFLAQKIIRPVFRTG
jgi:CheY-like chemotaxis protein